MDQECVAVEDDDAAVAAGGPQGWVRLWNRRHPWEDELLTFCARIGGNGMEAAVHNVVVHNEAPEKFVGELAESFAGWSGAKVWESLDRDVRIKAVFRNGGHVDLTWRLAPWRRDDAWQAEVTFQVEAGEEMRKLAADMGVLLGCGQGEP